MTVVGSNGNCWSSAPASSGSLYAGYLYFSATYVTPLNGNYRANGFPVRCYILGWHDAANVDFYPASGCRYRSSGALTYVGSNGYCWCSALASSGSINAGNLNFSATGVYPLDSNRRASGFAVRCVRE